jgi:hypothetical protein
MSRVHSNATNEILLLVRLFASPESMWIKCAFYILNINQHPLSKKTNENKGLVKDTVYLIMPWMNLSMVTLFFFLSFS